MIITNKGNTVNDRIKGFCLHFVYSMNLSNILRSWDLIVLEYTRDSAEFEIVQSSRLQVSTNKRIKVI